MTRTTRVHAVERRNPDSTQCHGTRRDGTPCQSTVILASGYCQAHDPERRARLKDIGAAGGRAKATSARAAKLVPSVLLPVLDTLLAAVSKVEAGTMTPSQASALAALSGAIVRVYQAGTLEERVAALEAATEEAAPARRWAS